MHMRICRRTRALLRRKPPFENPGYAPDRSREGVDSLKMGDDGQPVEITALNNNIEFITSSVQSNPVWFANSLVEKDFIPFKTSQTILGTMGVPASRHVSLLMDAVYTKIGNVDNKREWFDKFVAIFSRDAAYTELVMKLKRSVGGDGT